MKAIFDFLLSLVSPAKVVRQTSTTALADALARDVQALESGDSNPGLKKSVLQKAKQIISQVGGTEMIIPGYAVVVSLTPSSKYP